MENVFVVASTLVAQAPMGRSDPEVSIEGAVLRFFCRPLG